MPRGAVSSHLVRPRGGVDGRGPTGGLAHGERDGAGAGPDPAPGPMPITWPPCTEPMTCASGRKCTDCGGSRLDPPPRVVRAPDVAIHTCHLYGRCCSDGGRSMQFGGSLECPFRCPASVQHCRRSRGLAGGPPAEVAHRWQGLWDGMGRRGAEDRGGHRGTWPRDRMGWSPLNRPARS